MYTRKIGDLFGYRHNAVNDTNHDVFVLLERSDRDVVLYNLHAQAELKVTHHIFASFYSPLSKSVRVSQIQNQV
jgi:hypothetical protein